MEHGIHVSLQDADGIFLEVEPTIGQGDDRRVGGSDGEPERDVGSEDVEDLRQELEAAKDAGEALQRELDDLRQKLEQEKAKTRDLWRANYVQLTEFDNTVTEKDEEIEQLKEQLARASCPRTETAVKGRVRTIC